MEHSASFSLIKNQPVYINGSSNDFIELSSLNNGGNVGGNGTATIMSNSNTITLNENIPAALQGAIMLEVMF